MKTLRKILGISIILGLIAGFIVVLSRIMSLEHALIAVFVPLAVVALVGVAIWLLTE